MAYCVFVSFTLFSSFRGLDIGVHYTWLQAHRYRVSVVYTTHSSQVASAILPSAHVGYAPCTPAHYYLGKVTGGFRALSLRLRAWESAWAIYRVLREIDRYDKIDLVEITEGLPVHFFKRRWPVIVRAHGSAWSVRHFCKDGDARGDKWLIGMEAQQLRHADAVCAVSQHLANHLSEFCVIPLNRIQVIPCPIDEMRFSPALHQCPDMDLKRPVVLTVGRLEKRKGVDVLLKAVSSKVWEKFPSLNVHLAGIEAGLSKDELLQTVSPHKQDRVSFLGLVDNQQMPAYYRQASMYVTPTLYETFGYAIAEAMACGLPVIASRVGAVPELVEHDTTGLLLPANEPESLAQAILLLMDDDTMRKRMGKRGRDKAVASYGLERVAAQMVALYNRVLSTNENGGTYDG